MALIVLSGPSGVGKNTIVEEVLKKIPTLKLGQSLTTRKKRPNDVPGKYQYVDKDKFRLQVEKGGLLEWAEYNGNLYGTLKPDLNENLLFEIEVQGASQIKTLYPETLLILIVPPGKNIDEQISVLRQRLRNRGTDDEDTIKKRLIQARQELLQGIKQSEKIVVNDKLDEAINEVIDIIKPLLH